MAAPINGIDMAVSGEHTVRQWRIEDRSEYRPIVPSNSNGGVVRMCAIEDWVGLYLGYGGQPQDGVFPGETFTFTGSIDGSVGYSGSAYCELLEVSIDHEDGGYVEYAVQFSRAGTLTPGAAVVSDDTVPNPDCGQGLTVTLDGTGQSHVHRMKMTIFCPGRKYVDSDSEGGRARTKGRMDVTIEYDVYFESPAADLPSKETDYEVGFEVESSTPSNKAWDISFMRVTSIVPIVDSESDENVGATVTLKLNASDGSSAGSIVDPDGTQLWPTDDSGS